MSTPTALSFRDARDRLIDLLGLGDTYPLRDVPVTVDRLIVPFDSTAEIPVTFAQSGVTYGLRDKDGHPVGALLTGNGRELLIETPPIQDDITYTVHARKPNGKEGDLFDTAPVKVGLDIDLEAVILPADGLQPRLIDYGGVITVRIAQSQNGVDYRLVQFPAGDPPHPEDMAAAANDSILSAGDLTVRGTGGAIDLVSKPMAEDTVLRIREIKVFDTAIGRPPQTNILTARLPLLVRADPGRGIIAVPAAVVDFQTVASVRVAQAQAGVSYRACVHRIADQEYQQGASPVAGIASVPVAGAPNALIQLPALPPEGAALAGFSPAGSAEVPGIGADLTMPLPAVTDDILVTVLATKHHQTVGGTATSAVWLAQTPAVLARPDPNAAIRARVWTKDGTTTGTLELIGGQPGVFYSVAPPAPAAAVQPPVYVHKHDAHDRTANKGLGQLKIEVDYVLARDPLSAPSSDLAHTYPPPPLLVTPAFPAGTTVSLHAVKAQTGAAAILPHGW